VGDVGSHTFSIRVTDSGSPPLSNQKSLTVTVRARPDLTLTALGTSATLVSLGGTFSVSSSVKNVGGSAAGAFVTAFSLSRDGAFGGADDVPFAATRSLSSLSAGSTSTGSTTLTIPVGTPLGSYVLCASADGANAVSESNESNNALCTTSTLVVSAPDLRVSALSPLSTTVARRAKLKISNTVTNEGGVSSKKCAVAFALSTDPFWSGDDRGFATRRSLVAIAAGSSSTATTSPTVPADTPPGFYYVCAFADIGGVVVESDEEDNSSCSGAQVEVR
jgi:subtilase family serine protease